MPEGRLYTLPKGHRIGQTPGCLLQMRSSLADAGAQRPMYHLVELVDASIRGTHPARAP